MQDTQFTIYEGSPKHMRQNLLYLCPCDVLISSALQGNLQPGEQGEVTRGQI